ncbi:unnamed protein product [Sphagnum jensenii]|uniref:SGNH hydrolase-type esterase domain-containing protein n=1 Tax=Sphagnum jensenii TaxID=128206 RepID=A0ABP0W0L0_9BRYO
MAPPHARPLFVLYGASMTQFSFELGGWGAALADLYSRKADILLRGYSGWNTRRAIEALDTIFPKDASVQPALVVVFFGANDAAFPSPTGSGGQHVPIAEFQENLCHIAAHLQGLSEKTHVILTTAPPIHEESRCNWLSDRTNERAGQYAAACRAAAKQMGAGVIDLWTSIQKHPNWQTECLSDGMHLAPEGSKVMLKELLQVLKDAPWEPSLHHTSLPNDFPLPHIYDYVPPA